MNQKLKVVQIFKKGWESGSVQVEPLTRSQHMALSKAQKEEIRQRHSGLVTQAIQEASKPAKVGIRCPACGYRVRGANHAQGKHHQANRPF